MTRFRLFAAGAGAIALHVADDSFLQPQAGTSAVDHVAGGLIPLALLALAVPAFPRVRAGSQAALAALIGFFGLVASSEALYYARHGGLEGDDFTGLLCIPGGLALLGLAAVTLWTSRRLADRMPRRYGRRSLKGAGAFALAFLVLFPLGYSYIVTHAARGYVPPPSWGPRTSASRSGRATA